MAIVARNTDELVDAFIAYVNDTGLEPKFLEDVPEELQTTKADYDTVNWRIQPASDNPWVETVAQRLPQSWPEPFRSMIARYRFTNFEIGPLMFFANSGDDLFYELSNRIFQDKGIYPLLHRNGLLQFGIPHEGNYDPVCFDMQRRRYDDAPIVQLDHEEILLRNRLRVITEIAPSLEDFMQSAMAQKLPVH